MALNFNTSGRFVSHGSGAALDDLGAGKMTVWAWVYRESNGANQHIITKDSGFPMGWAFVCDNGAGEGELRFLVFRTDGTAGNWTDFISTTAIVPLNTWTFVAATYDDGLSPEVDLYSGSLTAIVAEVSSYARAQDGAGASLSDAAANLYVGNLQRATTLPFLGSIARGGIIADRLTLGQLRRLQFAPLSQCRVGSTVLLFDYHGTGTQVDLSGDSQPGTVTSAVAADHVPLGPPFGWDETAPYVVVAGGGTVYENTAAPAGVATTSADLATIRAVAAQAAGVGAVTLDLTVVREITAAAQGIGAVTVDLATISAAGATSAGVGTVSVDLAVVRSLGTVQADGVGTATVTISTQATAQISAAAAGIGTATVDLARQAHRDVAAAGVGAAAVDMAVVRAFSASPAGTGTAAVDLAIIRTLSATSAGIGTATLTITSSADAAAVTGKYAAEHAQAYADVLAVEQGDFSGDHAQAYKDILDGGV